MKSDFLIVSVESRKGGVGKTTAALNLARILMERRKHAVLFLDADITGTNATDCIDSPFWKGSCHPIRSGTGSDISPANLLSIFQKQFMPGLARPAFVEESQSGNDTGHGCLTYAANMINVFGSQIYDFSHSSCQTGDTCICSPSVLFDELHAFWFIEFLQSVCQAFVDANGKDEPGRPVAVIIDNSPGYVGIAPAVQEWLTDIGPEKGKFLTIASLDKQDYLSCANGVHHIHQVYTRKWQTSRKFVHSTSQTRATVNQIELARDEEGFFVRLVEMWQPHRSHQVATHSLRLNQDDLAFYRIPDCSKGEIYLNRPERYQGLVINRVPHLVKRGVYTYDTERMYSLMRQKDENVIQHLLGEGKDSYSHYMVSYDESIEYQFVQPMISRRHGRLSRRKRRFDDLTHSIEARHPLPPDELIQGMLENVGGFPPEMFREVRLYVRNIGDMVEDVIRVVEQSGFSYLTHLIHQEWLPRNILRDVSISIQDILLEMDGPSVEFAPWEASDDQIGPETYMVYEELRHHMNQHLERRQLAVQLPSADRFLSSLALVAGLSMGRRGWHPKRDPEFAKLFGSIAAIEVLHWTRERKRSTKRLSIQRFLAAESLLERESMEFHEELPTHPRWLELGVLPRLYSACASAQARLIDVRRDAAFLIQLIRRLVLEDIREAPVLPYIRGIAEKVIVRKTMSHESAEEQIAKGFSNAQYMDEFSEVLERILTRWEGQE